jgi:hypothetical protein
MKRIVWVALLAGSMCWGQSSGTFQPFDQTLTAKGIRHE